MRISQVKLTNFRCFKQQIVELSAYTALVGQNNSGKSTVLRAIDIFFSSTQRDTRLTIGDFNDPLTSLEIGVVFEGISTEAAKTFAHYYRAAKLEFFIRARIEANQVQASIHGRRRGIPDFGKFHVSGLTAADRKAAYRELAATRPELPAIPTARSVDVFRAALQSYEDIHPEQHADIDSEDLAFGASGVISKIRQYIDWVYIPAVKDVAEEDTETRNTAFGLLVQRLIRSKVDVESGLEKIRSSARSQISRVVAAYRAEVTNLEKQLDDEFREITSNDAHVHLEWEDVGDDGVDVRLPLVRSVLSDGQYRGDVGRFGHGLQRNYLFSLVHLNAAISGDERPRPKLVIAVEEPELYQHPPQARYLRQALHKMSRRDQVLITTHSPYFISVDTFEDIRIVSRAGGGSRISYWSVDEQRSLIGKAFGELPIGKDVTAAKLEQFMQPEYGEAFFCGHLVLVEGAEDKALLLEALRLSDQFDNFVRQGGHIISTNGKGGLIQMAAMARGFEKPCLIVFDADTNAKKEKDIKDNKRLNKALAHLMGLDEDAATWPLENVVEANAIIWKENIQAALLADDAQWNKRIKEVTDEFQWDHEKLRKNPTVLAATLRRAHSAGVKFKALERAVTTISKFVESL